MTSEIVTFRQYLAGRIPTPRVLSMLAGEVVRLDGYARSGLIEVDEPVPADLLSGAHKLQDLGYDTRAL